MNKLIDNYFEFSYTKKNNTIVKVSMKIHSDKLTNVKTSANGSSEQWYLDKFGKKLGTDLYTERKKYNSVNSIVDYMINTSTSPSDIILLNEYKCNVNNKSRKSNVERYSDITFKADFVKKMNKSERIEKISIASKQMWKNADNDLIYRMINSSKRKNYEFQGYQMNYIEYQIAVLLTELKIQWEYEPIVRVNNSMYRPDFLCKELNLVVECYGDFWHVNPKYFSNRKYTHKTRSVTSVYEYDERKKTDFQNNGYGFAYFWEDDIINDIEQIKHKLCGLKKK